MKTPKFPPEYIPFTLALSMVMGILLSISGVLRLKKVTLLRSEDTPQFWFWVAFFTAIAVGSLRENNTPVST